MQLTLQTLPDQYEVLEEIAKGGMAQVYKARQLSLGRIVALKEIKPAFATNPELRERFKREARIAANLVHENIVQVYNFGEPASGPLFIVMEFVDGLDLKTILARRGPLPPRLAAFIGREVARALHYAHTRGLIHRDVKPGNIMVSRQGEVKLMDFGIVREMDSDLTRTGAFLGTPSYMSPEQLLGEELTPATDLFSLGIVLYEILAGQKPFKADSEASLSKKIRTEKEAPLRSLNPAVPRRLHKLVHQLLAKNPLKRPDAETLVHALDKVLGRGAQEQVRPELATWMQEEFGEARPEPEVSAVPILPREPIKQARVIRSAAEPPPPKPQTLPEKLTASPPIISPPPFEARPTEEAEDRPSLRKNERAKFSVKEDQNQPLRAVRVVRREDPSGPQSLREDEILDEEEEERPGIPAGEWLLKWLWRLILLAIILLAAIAAFILLDPESLSRLSLDFSPFQRILEWLHSLRK